MNATFQWCIFLSLAVVSAIILCTELAAAPAPDTPPGGLLILDNCDPDYEGKEAYTDNLSLIDSAGKLVFRVSGFNVCESIGSNHPVASDTNRGWIWVLENVAHRIRKFDRKGKELLVIPNVKASALAADPETGNLWVVTSQGTIPGEKTNVYDAQGRHLVTHDVSG
jgi:hypothetical protein